MTHNLVPSDRVEGAPVYGPDGEKIGSIERLMLDKSSGLVAYAVLRCGGSFSSPPHFYPVPWNSLKYNPGSRAYEIEISMQDLREGPCELDGETFDWGERAPSYRGPQYWTV